jgi:hypothetical protein
MKKHILFRSACLFAFVSVIVLAARTSIETQAFTSHYQSAHLGESEGGG